MAVKLYLISAFFTGKGCIAVERVGRYRNIRYGNPYYDHKGYEVTLLALDPGRRGGLPLRKGKARIPRGVRAFNLNKIIPWRLTAGGGGCKHRLDSICYLFVIGDL
jgi:hypothetical protein